MGNDIITRVGWDTSPAEAGQKKAIALAEGYASSAHAAGAKADKGLSGGLAGLGSKAKDALGMLGVGIGIEALRESVGGTIEHFRNLHDQAEKINATGEAIQRLDLFGARTNTSAETLTAGLLKMNKALSDPENDKGARALRDLGVSVSALIKMQPDQQIEALAGAFQRAQETGQGFHEIYSLIGKTAGELIPVLKTTRDEFAALSSQPILSDAELNKINEMGEKLSAAGRNWEVVKGKAIIGTSEFIDAVGSAEAAGIESIKQFYAEVSSGVPWDKAIANAKRLFAEAQQPDEAEKKKKEPKGPLISPGPTKEEQKKAATDLQGKLAIGEELKLLAAKATGNDRLIKQAEREAQIAAKKQELMKKGGLSPKEAEKTANLMADLQDKAARKANGGRSDKIVTLPNKPRATFAGLDAFDERQRRETVTKHFADGHSQQFPNPNGRRVHKPGDDQQVAGDVPPPHKDPGGPNASRRLEEIMQGVKNLIDERLKVAY